MFQEKSEQDLRGSPFNLLCLLLDCGAQCRRRITLLVVFSDRSLSVKLFGRIFFVSCTPPSLLISTPDAQTAPSNIAGRLSEHSVSIMKSKCLLHKLKKNLFLSSYLENKKKSFISHWRGWDGELRLFIFTQLVWKDSGRGGDVVGDTLLVVLKAFSNPDCNGTHSQNWGHNLRVQYQTFLTIRVPTPQWDSF